MQQSRDIVGGIQTSWEEVGLLLCRAADEVSSCSGWSWLPFQGRVAVLIALDIPLSGSRWCSLLGPAVAAAAAAWAAARAAAGSTSAAATAFSAASVAEL